MDMFLVTAEREQRSVPRSGTGTRERFRSHSVKMHPKCRSSFWVRRSSLHRSGNSGDYGLNNSWKLPALKIQTTRSQKNKDSDNTRTEFMKKQSCFKFFFFFSTRICNFVWEILDDCKWETSVAVMRCICYLFFVSCTRRRQTWTLRHGICIWEFFRNSSIRTSWILITRITFFPALT